MLKEAGRPHPHEEKVTTDLCCEIAVDCKIVPFERVPDYAGGNYSASLCGVHLTPQYLHSAQVSRGVSLVNLLAFNTMSLSPSARAALLRVNRLVSRRHQAWRWQRSGAKASEDRQPLSGHPARGRAGKRPLGL